MHNAEHRPPALTLSRWLVGRYPQAWRERYDTEMLSLLQDSAPRTRDVLDQGPDGLIYLLTDEGDGAVLRLEPAP